MGSIIFRVLNRSGDTKTSYAKDDAKALAAADARFKELTGKGFLAIAYEGGGGSDGEVVKTFDPTKQEEVVFRPQIVGG